MGPTGQGECMDMATRNKFSSCKYKEKGKKVMVDATIPMKMEKD